MAAPPTRSKSLPRRLAGPPYFAVRRRLVRTRRTGRQRFRRWFGERFRRVHRLVSLPSTTVALMYNLRIHPAYRMSWRRKFALTIRMYRNTRKVFTGTSYKAHLAMAVKLLEIPPEVEGDVVECGCYLGGSTANLSLVCEIVGRRLYVYDSFEGLPAPQEGDQYATTETEGFLAADIDVVKDNVRRLGAIEVCEFRKGWFEDTLPDHPGPVVLCFLDVDYQSSLRDCILNLWPRLIDHGYVFIDEYVLLDYCALFWSERFWRQHFDRDPPGLVGAGSGIGVGEYYVGPINRRLLPLQGPASIAYTRKDSSGCWRFYPEDR